MATTLCSSRYSIPLSEGEWGRLRHLEDTDIEFDLGECVKEWVNADRIEYSGHYGRFLFFEVDADQIKHRVKIERAFRKQLRWE